MNETILNALNWRYATKTFDPTKKVSDSDFEIILESGRLSPSSIGLEPWKFIVVTNPDVRVKLRAVSYDQSKVTDASHVVVIARRTDIREHGVQNLIDRVSNQRSVDVESLDGLKQMATGQISMKNDEQLDEWNAKQTYISLGMMIETAALLGVDSCPMEGFNSKEVDEVLGLKEKKLTSTIMIVFGYRGEDDFANLKKVRREKKDVIEWVK